MQQMMEKPAVSCEEPAWTLFGVSMAGYNALLSTVVGIWATATAGAILLGKGRSSR
jgi:disulfide bond formation protein DsbB